MSDLEAIRFSAEEMDLIVKSIRILNSVTDDDDELEMITAVLDKIIESIQAS